MHAKCNGFSGRREIIFFVSFLAFFVFNTSFAQSPNQTYASAFEFSKVQINLLSLTGDNADLVKEPSVSKNISMVFQNSNVANPSNNSVLPAGFELVVLIDNACSKNMAQTNPAGAPMALPLATSSANLSNLELQAYDQVLSEDTSVSDLSALAEGDPCVMGVSENRTFSVSLANLNDDPQAPNQGHLTNIAVAEGHNLFYHSSVGMSIAPVPPADAKPVVISIVDTGVEHTHDDLNAAMWTNANGEFGFDFVNNDVDPMDDQGHGTHVAGLSAAKSSNQIGVSGVMGFNAQIMGIKVLDAAGSGTIADIVNGINFSADNGADIINMSLGGPGASIMLRDSMARAVNLGSTVLVAAGNENLLITANDFVSPAGYGQELAGVITVGSIDSANSTRSGFSNFSTTFVEVASPGSGPAGILSTAINNGYVGLQGTSMATPIYAGATGLVIGLMKQNNIAYTPAMVEDIIQKSALKDQNLVQTFKDGNRLHIGLMAEYMEKSLLFDANGGMSEDF